MALSQEEIDKMINDSYELPNNVLNTVPKPMVTVRTSTYQHESYIKDCIEGVLMQKTEFPFEFIIGEDFSVDGTREIVFDYATKYPDTIRVITADYNVGAKANGLRCKKAARGKYMAICEGDDYWTDPYKLQNQVSFLEQNSNYVLSHTNCDILMEYKQNKIKKNINSDYSKIDSSSKKKLFKSIASGHLKIRTATAVFKIEYLKEFEGDKVFKMGDTPLWLNLSQKGKFHYLDESTAVYRVSYGSVSRPRNRLEKYKFLLSGELMSIYYFEKYSYEVPDEIKYRYLNRLREYMMLGGGWDFTNERYVDNEIKEELCAITGRNSLLNKAIFYRAYPKSFLFDSKQFLLGKVKEWVAASKAQFNN